MGQPRATDWHPSRTGDAPLVLEMSEERRSRTAQAEKVRQTLPAPSSELPEQSGRLRSGRTGISFPATGWSHRRDTRRFGRLDGRCVQRRRLSSTSWAPSPMGPAQQPGVAHGPTKVRQTAGLGGARGPQCIREDKGVQRGRMSSGWRLQEEEVGRQA